MKVASGTGHGPWHIVVAGDVVSRHKTRSQAARALFDWLKNYGWRELRLMHEDGNEAICENSTAHTVIDLVHRPGWCKLTCVRENGADEVLHQVLGPHYQYHLDVMAWRPNKEPKPVPPWVNSTLPAPPPESPAVPQTTQPDRATS